MDATIIVAIITNVCTLIGVIVTVAVSGKKTKTEIEMRQKHQQEQIDDIKKKLQTHNDYAVKIPVIETELKFIREDIGEIKKKVIQ